MHGQEPPLIQLDKVRRLYGEGDSIVRALDGIDLVIERGELVMVMGSSGSGKSTCMNMLGCLDRPTSGAYRFLGVDVGKLDRDGLALLRRHYLGFVFQSFNLLPRTSAVENVELPLVYRGVRRKLRRATAMRSLELVKLGQRWGHTPAQLSGGQQQRVAIARALVTDPAVLFADEPTGNLDSETTTEIMNLLVDLNRTKGITIVMVTHEPELTQYATRVITFKDGKIVADERKEPKS
ncbi:MAG: ABC transporter ATP-binding protein [Deltaproteobacteria bacterium]|nr:ABC transporter ATP-binding protein [Nannocystaceae bacterium]